MNYILGIFLGMFSFSLIWDILMLFKALAI